MSHEASLYGPQDGNGFAEASPPNPTSSPANPPSTRDGTPLPDAAKRVIRNQRGGGHTSMALHMQAFKQRTLQPSPGPAPRRTTKGALPPRTQRAIRLVKRRPPRTPTVQEMYNTWRALEEQVDKIRRLPMFIKVERRFCHTCRVLKHKCDCFDYSSLEQGYQEADKVLKHAVLHELPFPAATDEQSEGENDDGDRPGSTLSFTRCTANGDRRSPTPKTSVPMSLDEPAASALQWAPGSTTSAPKAPPVREIDEFGRPIHTVREGPPRLAYESMDAPARTHAASPPSPAPAAAPAAASDSHDAPELFGTGGAPGAPVCTREDDNMDTVRRHYGREHGRHRYHTKPTLRARCCRCGFAVEKRVPSRCPQCSLTRGIWLRELYARIEVPVVPAVRPSSGSGSGSSSSSQEGANGANDIDPIADHQDQAATPLANSTKPAAGFATVPTPRPASASSDTPTPWLVYSNSNANSNNNNNTSTPSPYLQSVDMFGGMVFPVASNGPFSFPTTPVMVGTPLTPLTPITPMSSASVTYASGVGVESDPMALFPYEPIDMAAADCHSRSLSFHGAAATATTTTGVTGMPPRTAGYGDMYFGMGLDVQAPSMAAMQLSPFVGQQMDMHLEQQQEPQEEAMAGIMAGVPAVQVAATGTDMAAPSAFFNF
ncbi:alkane 1-monooxygenase [Niveomyces insectorum RCEF 264]|uniref:Alkane 1-monooxygenase n=1 Tax=Niveomyces insectorum RCEF 264 TaxID=1081102 RepID=A0A167W9P9_9HYPO|nr:alkane 1-monooxygenase [Niveomyces insectorum RCEF 264]